jgi:hypothetical protein
MPPRSRRTQSEWKVQTVIASAAFLLTMPPMRSRISLAALLVKVTARICSAGIFFSSMCAIRQVTVRVLPVPAPGEDQDRAIERGHGLALGLVEGVE